MSAMIYRKTAQGQSAMHDRTLGLSMQQRSVMIMVDGNKSVTDLLRFGAAFGDVNAILDQLVANHLIEATGQVAWAKPSDPTPTSSPTPTPTAVDAAVAPQPVAAPVGVPLTLKAFQRDASRALLDGMGPSADTVCERLERAKDAAEALKHANMGLMMLRDARRVDAAARLVALIERLGD